MEKSINSECCFDGVVVRSSTGQRDIVQVATKLNGRSFFVGRAAGLVEQREMAGKAWPSRKRDP